jgi:hypothetical protein
MNTEPLDLRKLRVFPLAERRSLTRAVDILIDPDSAPKPIPTPIVTQIRACARAIRTARRRGAAVMLIYGAHLLRNGAARMLDRLIADGWLTHLATNGAGTIHDWEYSWFGASTESVEQNVANGSFGAWDETSTNIHRALMAGALDGLGYGASLGRLIAEDGVTLPDPATLEAAVIADPRHPLTAARADLLQTMETQGWTGGHVAVEHRWKQASILASAYRHGVPMTVHPGIGYDIISNHPIFNGAVIGRAAELDFKLFAGSLQSLGGGVVLSVGSAIMGPQVFEKAISCVNNLRLQDDQPVIRDHSIHVVDLQDGGGWDWSKGEPPKTNPAYYLRFCKSFSRMGGTMHYTQCDNAAYIHHLFHELIRS